MPPRFETRTDCSVALRLPVTTIVIPSRGLGAADGASFNSHLLPCPTALRSLRPAVLQQALVEVEGVRRKGIGECLLHEFCSVRVSLQELDYPLEPDAPEEVSHLPRLAELLLAAVGEVEFEERVGHLRDVLPGDHAHVDLVRLGVGDVSALVSPVLGPSELQGVQVEARAHPAYGLGRWPEALPLAPGDADR